MQDTKWVDMDYEYFGGNNDTTRDYIEEKIKNDYYDKIMEVPADIREKKLRFISPLVTEHNKFLADYLAIPKEFIWLIVTLNDKMRRSESNGIHITSIKDFITTFNKNVKTALIKQEVGNKDFAITEIAEQISLELGFDNADDIQELLTNRHAAASASKNDGQLDASFSSPEIINVSQLPLLENKGSDDRTQQIQHGQDDQIRNKSPCPNTTSMPKQSGLDASIHAKRNNNRCKGYINAALVPGDTKKASVEYIKDALKKEITPIPDVTWGFEGHNPAVYLDCRSKAHLNRCAAVLKRRPKPITVHTLKQPLVPTSKQGQLTNQHEITDHNASNTTDTSSNSSRPAPTSISAELATLSSSNTQAAHSTTSQHQYKLIGLPHYVTTQQIKQELDRFGLIQWATLKRTESDLQYNSKNNDSNTCTINFAITAQQKTVLDNTWAIPINGQCIRLAPAAFTKQAFKDRCKYTIGYKDLPPKASPQELLELTANLGSKSCYLFRSIGYISFESKGLMDAALLQQITYDGIALSAKIKGEKYVRKADPMEWAPTMTNENSPQHSYLNSVKGKMTSSNNAAPQSASSVVPITPSSNGNSHNHSSSNTNIDKLDLILKKLDDMETLKQQLRLLEERVNSTSHKSRKSRRAANRS